MPLNTVFGIVCGLAIVRGRFPGKGLLNAFVDLPLALSPVVVGVSLFLLYGRTGWFGHWLIGHGYQVLFAMPAIVLATIFVSLPFVAREVVPDPARDRRRSRSRPRTRSAPRAGRRSGGSRCRRSAGP